MHPVADTYAMNAEIDLKHLRHWALLAEELNFSRAAERAHLSQTAFSRSIQALEEGLGLRLFDRDTRSVSITAAGRQLLPHARQVLANAADIRRESDAIAQATGGELAFGASFLAVDGVLRGLLPALRRVSPGLKLDIKVAQAQVLQEWLEEDRIEFFVGYCTQLSGDANFVVTPLRAEPGSIYCRSAHPLAGALQRPTPQDVLAYPWGAVQATQASLARVRAWLGLPTGSPMPADVICDNQTLLRELMLDSDTLLFTWRSWLQADLDNGTAVDLGQLLEPAAPASLMQLDCGIVQRAGRSTSPGARRVIGLIDEAVQRLPV